MKLFPILTQQGPYAGRTRTLVPWEWVEPHWAQAKKNHGQTLERLAERGGLSISELAAVLEDREWRRMEDEDAWQAIYARVGGRADG